MDKTRGGPSVQLPPLRTTVVHWLATNGGVLCGASNGRPALVRAFRGVYVYMCINMTRPRRSSAVWLSGAYPQTARFRCIWVKREIGYGVLPYHCHIPIRNCRAYSLIRIRTYTSCRTHGCAIAKWKGFWNHLQQQSQPHPL